MVSPIAMRVYTAVYLLSVYFVLPENRFDARRSRSRKSPPGIEIAATGPFPERLPNKEQRWPGPRPRQRW
jgi:hypothetical protein